MMTIMILADRGGARLLGRVHLHQAILDRTYFSFIDAADGFSVDAPAGKTVSPSMPLDRLEIPVAFVKKFR